MKTGFKIATALLLLLVPVVARSGDAPSQAGRRWEDRATGDWGGSRAALLARGVELDLDLVADSSASVAGGLRRGGVVRGPLSLALSVDLDRFLDWSGGQLGARIQANRGLHGGEALVGDVQGFSNIDAPRLRQVSELWLEQALFTDRLRLRAGKLDANADFAFVEHGADFLNSAAGFSPTIQGFPTYPDPASGVNAFLSPRPWLYAGAGLYDGATREGCHGRTGNRGPSTLLGQPDALFLVGEVGLRWRVGGRHGRAGAGAWRHTGRFERFEGGIDLGSSGAYLVVDQELRPENGDAQGQGLAAFAQYGSADRKVSVLDQHLALGLVWTGFARGRDADAVGLLISRVRFSDLAEQAQRATAETAAEAFYKLQLRPWLAVHSDLQWITGLGHTRAALVATARISLAF